MYCLSKKKCYFCTRIGGEVHTNTDLGNVKKELEIIQK